ncbi:MAG: hypothetical protein V4651_05475 [Bacteroidota bacterium]
MKSPICLVLLLMYCLQADAQKVRDKQIRDRQLFIENGLIDIQAGIAIPVMDFADNNFKKASGYATLGYAVRLGIRYDILPTFGLGLHYQYFQNGFDQSDYLDDMRTANKGVTINSFSSDPWNLQGMMFGLYCPLKSSRSSIDIGLAGGVLTGSYPENVLNFNDPTVPGRVYNIKQFETSAANFAFQAGVKMRYQLYKSIMLSASADFTYTEIDYTDIRAEETNSHVTIPLDTYTQYYHIIQLSAGIGIQVK